MWGACFITSGMSTGLIIYGCFLRFFMVLRKSFYPQYARAYFITGIKEGMFITMFIRALTRGARDHKTEETSK